MAQSPEELAFLKHEKKLREGMKKTLAEIADIPKEYLPAHEREIAEMRRLTLERKWADLDSGKSVTYEPAVEARQLADTKRDIDKRIAPKVAKAKHWQSCKNSFVLFFSIAVALGCYIKWASDHPYHPFLQTEQHFWLTFSIVPAGLLALFFLLAWYDADVNRNK